VCVMGVLVCIQHHNKLTVLAKVHTIHMRLQWYALKLSQVLLLLGLLFLIVDDIPNSLLATGNFCSGKI